MPDNGPLVGFALAWRLSWIRGVVLCSSWNLHGRRCTPPKHVHAQLYSHAAAKPPRQRSRRIILVLGVGVLAFGSLNLLLPLWQQGGVFGAPAATPVLGETKLKHLGSHEREVVAGNRTYKPSFGLFPKGCRWREVHEQGTTGGGKRGGTYMGGGGGSRRQAGQEGGLQRARGASRGSCGKLLHE